jgi:hypothetical protein
VPDNDDDFIVLEERGENSACGENNGLPAKGLPLMVLGVKSDPLPLLGVWTQSVRRLGGVRGTLMLFLDRKELGDRESAADCKRPEIEFSDEVIAKTGQSLLDAIDWGSTSSAESAVVEPPR